jgi:hypothetical protein
MRAKLSIFNWQSYNNMIELSETQVELSELCFAKAWIAALADVHLKKNKNKIINNGQVCDSAPSKHASYLTSTGRIRLS